MFQTIPVPLRLRRRLARLFAALRQFRALRWAGSKRLVPGAEAEASVPPAAIDERAEPRAEDRRRHGPWTIVRAGGTFILRRDD